MNPPTDISNQPAWPYWRRKVSESPQKLFIWAVMGILLVYAIKQPIPSVWYKAGAGLGLVVLAWFLPKFYINPFFWLYWLAYFVGTLAMRYYWAANHHFVACYLILAILIFCVSGCKADDTLRFHLRFILLSILGFGAIHKFLSEPYMNGALFQMNIHLNVFLKPLAFLFPDWKEITNYNQEAFNVLLKKNPGQNETLILQAPIKNIHAVARVSSWAAIILEALAGIAIFFKSEKAASHLLLCTTILGVFIFRFETGFLSLLAIMGFYLTKAPLFQKIYAGLIVLFSLLIISGYGLR